MSLKLFSLYILIYLFSFSKPTRFIFNLQFYHCNLFRYYCAIFKEFLLRMNYLCRTHLLQKAFVLSNPYL